MPNHTCCFFGHREIYETDDLIQSVSAAIDRLIVAESVDTFLFGSKSQFNSLCYELVTKVKEKYPHIRRIYVRAEFPVIDDFYKSYLLGRYEDTYYPQKLIGAGKAVYVERNIEMIKKSRFCLVYYDETLAPTRRKSGTKVAVEYAIRLKRQLLYFP